MIDRDSGAADAPRPAPSYRALPGLPPLALVALYVGLGLAPLVLAASQGLPVRSFWRALASGLAMVGFAMLLVQFLLSGRFPQVSGKVGIDLTMRFHQLAAWTILAFILVHPLLYAVPRLSPNPLDALETVRRMFSFAGFRTGVVAWWLVILLVAMGAWRDRLPVRYELWRLTHGLGAAAIAGFGLDHTLRVGAHAADPWLAGFWIVLTGLAVASLAHVYVVKPLLQARAPYRVVANDKVADRMWRVVVEPRTGEAIDFAPGQFVWLNLGHSPFSLTEHPFSISSAPADRPRIAFTIKESGDFTDRIGEVRVGTTAHIDGPHGNFTLAGRAPAPLTFVVGGVGFAPAIGILRQLGHDGWPRRIVLLYGNRVASQILYREEIESLRRRLDLDVRLVLSEPPPDWPGPVGELTPDVLRACLEPLDPRALYFVCGPTPMMDSVERSLADMGVPPARVVSERFKYD